MKYILLSLSFLLLTISACTYTMKIQDGAMAYDRKQYSVAVEMLKKEYNKSDSRIEKGKIAYLIGKSYEELHQGVDAINWFKIAYDNQYGVDALKDYAYALKASEQYTEAKAAFKELGLEIGSPYEYRKDILACEIAEQWAAEERVEYQIENLAWNTSASEYAPILFEQDKLIVTSDRANATGGDTYNWTGKTFSDLFTVNLETETFDSFDPMINSEANEGTLAISPKGEVLIFTRCAAPKGEDAYCQLFQSHKIGGQTWGEPQRLTFTKAGVNYMHPAFSPDGQQLYFSSDDPEGWGGFDLYVSQKQANGLWDEPKLLSRSINTYKDDQFPFIDQDTLYFASTGHTGMGGLDIFRSYKLPSGNWAPPKNMRPPVNSGGDDFGFVIDRRVASKDANILAKGYFSSHRLEGKGGDDIYLFEKIVPPPAPEPEVIEGPIVYKNILEVYVLEKIYEDPSDPNSRILGRRPLGGSNLRIQLGSEVREVEISEEGKIRLDLRDNLEYNFLATKEEYLSNDARFSSVGLGKDPTQPNQLYEVEIVLDKIFKNREIVLENIYYDFDQWFIRDDAQPTLKELSALLALNPAISIQLGSHTDCQGNDRYNETLSQRRAQAAVDYLISLGIDGNRLEAKGYGEEIPADDCLCTRCTDDQHQANRRTTFRILE